MKKNTEKKKKKQEIIKNYDLTSDFYDKRYVEIQHEKYNLVFQNFELTGKIILDAGCGTGLLFDFLLSLLARKFFIYYHYVAIDISNNMLKEFQSKLEQKTESNRMKVNLLLSDLENLPIRENIFNSLFSFTSFQNLPDIFKGLNESFRVIKHGADVYFSILKKKLNIEKVNLRLQNSLKNLKTINQEFLEDIIFMGKALKE
jgi:ubiquinone/menaquinone biosynthesis C-methylase UbiE